MDNIDYEKLRADLVEEYGSQMASFKGVYGFGEMCDAQNATNSELVQMAKNEHLNLDKYYK